ncbi:MAG TPA: hypothetical protein QF625_03035 [Candidatus Scalindua sp.]|nr:hypothetical protein [Candidatus Scalindua sp.]
MVVIKSLPKYSHLTPLRYLTGIEYSHEVTKTTKGKTLFRQALTSASGVDNRISPDWKAPFVRGAPLR